MSDDKVVHLKVIQNKPEDDADDEALLEEHKEMIDSLMEDGPFQFILGVARRKDGKFMTFSTSMDIRDYVFSIEVLKIQSIGMLSEAFDG